MVETLIGILVVVFGIFGTIKKEYSSPKKEWTHPSETHDTTQIKPITSNNDTIRRTQRTW